MRRNVSGFLVFLAFLLSTSCAKPGDPTPLTDSIQILSINGSQVELGKTRIQIHVKYGFVKSGTHQLTASFGRTADSFLFNCMDGKSASQMSSDDVLQISCPIGLDSFVPDIMSTGAKYVIVLATEGFIPVNQPAEVPVERLNYVVKAVQEAAITFKQPS